MNEYVPDIFYLNVREFKPELWEKICRDAHSKCYNWWVDDQPEWTRKKIEMELDEILKYLYTNSIHFSVIYRRGYENWNAEDSCNKWHLEIGFCTLARQHKNGDLFLWIELDESYIPYFIDTYDLKSK